MGRFKQMSQKERHGFLRKRRRQYGMAPERLPRKLTAKKTRKIAKGLSGEYWDTGAWATDPLTRRSAYGDARKAANLKYRPVLNEYRDELRASANQQKSIDQGFDLYKQQLADLSARTQGMYKGATQQVFNQANTMSQGDAASRATLDTAAQQSAAQRGATAAPSTASGQASKARQMLESSFGALIANRGTSAAGELLERERIGDRQRIAEHLKEQGYARDIGEKRRDVKLERGDFLNEYLSQLRENERRYGLERQAFGLEKRAQKADIQHQRRSDKLALLQEYHDAKQARRDDIRDRLKDRWDMTDDQIDNALAQQKEDFDQKHPNAGEGGGPSASVRQEAKEDWESAMARARAIVSDRKLSKLTIQQIAGNIESKTSAEYLIALAATQKAKLGHVKPGLAKKLRRRYGLQVGGGGGGAFNPDLPFGN